MAGGRIVITLILIAQFAVTTVVGNVCIDDCSYRPNGYYQSCDGCGMFVACNQSKLVTWQCSLNTVWDDNEKGCLSTSHTCPEVDMSSIPKRILTAEQISILEKRGWWPPSSWFSRRKPRPTRRPTTTTTTTTTTPAPTTTTTKAPTTTTVGYVGPFKNGLPNTLYYPGLGPLQCVDTTEGYEYKGRKSTTASGRTCQHWASQKPHGHANCKLQGRSNYCTNVNNPQCREAKPWCYTADPRMRWELCDIPKCLVCNGKDGSRCLRSCTFDGIFQSCHGCRMYATCSGGVMREWNYCPSGLVWDDDLKSCAYQSSTCREC